MSRNINNFSCYSSVYIFFYLFMYRILISPFRFLLSISFMLINSLVNGIVKIIKESIKKSCNLTNFVLVKLCKFLVYSKILILAITVQTVKCVIQTLKKIFDTEVRFTLYNLFKSISNIIN